MMSTKDPAFHPLPLNLLHCGGKQGFESQLLSRVAHNSFECNDQLSQCTLQYNSVLIYSSCNMNSGASECQ